MSYLIKKTPIETDEIHDELSDWLAVHKTDVVSIAVETEFGAPFILRYTIKNKADFDSAVSFIQTARKSGNRVGLYTRGDARRKMGEVARKILEHEPEHPYKRGLQWLVADSADSLAYHTDDGLFTLSVDFYNLMVRGIPDRYRAVFGMAIAYMQRRHNRLDTAPVSEPKAMTRRELMKILTGGEGAEEDGDTEDTEEVMNPDLTALYGDLLMF